MRFKLKIMLNQWENSNKLLWLGAFVGQCGDHVKLKHMK